MKDMKQINTFYLRDMFQAAGNISDLDSDYALLFFLL